MRSILITTAAVAAAIGLAGAGEPSLRKTSIEHKQAWIAQNIHKNSSDSYPDEINCVIDSVIPGFSQWEEFESPRSDSPVIDLLYSTNSPIRPVSFRLFKLSGKSSSRACIWVEIWKMKSSANARKIDTLIIDDIATWEMDYGSKTPKSFFVFKEYFILIHGCSFVVDRRIFGINKHIRKRCFNCGTIDGESPKDGGGNKYSCYNDSVIFGQNDKDW